MPDAVENLLDTIADASAGADIAHERAQSGFRARIAQLHDDPAERDVAIFERYGAHIAITFDDLWSIETLDRDEDWGLAFARLIDASRWQAVAELLGWDYIETVVEPGGAKVDAATARTNTAQLKSAALLGVGKERFNGRKQARGTEAEVSVP